MHISPSFFPRPVSSYTGKNALFGHSSGDGLEGGSKIIPFLLYHTQMHVIMSFSSQKRLKFRKNGKNALSQPFFPFPYFMLYSFTAQYSYLFRQTGSTLPRMLPLPYCHLQPLSCQKALRFRPRLRLKLPSSLHVRL